MSFLKKVFSGWSNRFSRYGCIGKVFMLCVTFFLLSIFCGVVTSPIMMFVPTSTPSTELAEIDEPTDEPEATDEPTRTRRPSRTPRPTDEPTDEPEPTRTPRPSRTPRPTVEPTDEPTRTPRPTRTARPTDEPTVYRGTGDDVITLDPFDMAVIVYIEGNAGGSYFGVETADEFGEYVDLLVNTTDPYKGIKILEISTRFIQVSASGDWSIRVEPLSSARQFEDEISGNGDDVVLYLGESLIANIKGNAAGSYFGVEALSDRINLLVNTTDPYEGKSILGQNTFMFIVTATGQWTIETE